MERNICVFQDFLTQAPRERIDAAARAAKMHVRYFETGQFEEAKEHLQHCEVLYAQSPQLLPLRRLCGGIVPLRREWISIAGTMGFLQTRIAC